MNRKPVSPIVKAAKWIGGFSTLLLHEMEKQGWADEEILSLVTNSDPNWQPIAKIVSNLRYGFPCEVFAHELIPSGFKPLQDVKPSEFQIEDLELVPFLNEDAKEGFVSGEEMRKRAVKQKANFGLVDGKRIRALKDQIPVEWQKFHLVLSGTLLFDPKDERLKVGVLHCQNGLWLLDFSWLSPGWYKYQRLVRVKSK